MKKCFVGLIALCLSCSSIWAQKMIHIENTLGRDRVELVSIPYIKFSKHFGVDTIFSIKDKAGKSYVHQLEKLGTNQVQNVLVQVPIGASVSIGLFVEKKMAPVPIYKTYARYVPERYDDFAWENDLVAFRLYGKGLEGRSDDAQGMDYWAKRTSDLIINKWYKGADYHVDHGEGLDYYAVGQTLGAGDLALYFHDKIYFTKHYRQHEILDNGPLRTTFRLSYESEVIDGQKVLLTKTFTLDAGKQFNRIVVSLKNKSAKKTGVAIGLAKRSEKQPKFEFDDSHNTLAYWEPSIKNFGQTGTALIFPATTVAFENKDDKQFLIKTSVKNNTSLVYYNGAAWDKAERITTADQWFTYVKQAAEAVQTPLRVKLKGK